MANEKTPFLQKIKQLVQGKSEKEVEIDRLIHRRDGLVHAITMAKKDAEIKGGARIDKPRLEKYMSEIRDIDKKLIKSGMSTQEFLKRMLHGSSALENEMLTSSAHELKSYASYLLYKTEQMPESENKEYVKRYAENILKNEVEPRLKVVEALYFENDVESVPLSDYLSEMENTLDDVASFMSVHIDKVEMELAGIEPEELEFMAEKNLDNFIGSDYIDNENTQFSAETHSDENECSFNDLEEER